MGHVSPVIGIITGLKLEADILRRASTQWNGALPLITTSGPGPIRARAFAEKLLNDGASALMSFGLAGGLNPALPAGSIIVPQEIYRTGMPALSCGVQWREGLEACLDGQLDLHAGPLMSHDEIVDSIAGKQALWQASSACAVDMESAAIAEVAAQANVAFLVVRAISDPAHMALPALAKEAVSTNGTTHRMGIAKSLLRQPGQIRELPALARQTKLATRALEKLARLAGPGFGFS